MSDDVKHDPADAAQLAASALMAATVLVAADECTAQAERLAARMPDGGMVWKDGDAMAAGARHCAAYVRVMAPTKPYAILSELENLRRREVRWHAAVGKLLMMEPGLRDAIGQLAKADVTELTTEGREARAWAGELVELMKGT